MKLNSIYAALPHMKAPLNAIGVQGCFLHGATLIFHSEPLTRETVPLIADGSGVVFIGQCLRTLSAHTHVRSLSAKNSTTFSRHRFFVNVAFIILLPDAFVKANYKFEKRIHKKAKKPPFGGFFNAKCKMQNAKWRLISGFARNLQLINNGLRISCTYQVRRRRS